MLNPEIYPQVLLAISAGLLTLLGSVGIFLSLIVQRRLDHLQDTLEEFINLSYRSETNLTGQMYNLIEKYQLYYMFPQLPRIMILRYIDINVIFIIIIWGALLISTYQPPLRLTTLVELLPLAAGVYATLFFRNLLRNTITLENPLLDSIIPVPTRLRSISYLSHFINLSVKSILKQARLTLFLTIKEGHRIDISLKEELSFDDFFYYLIIFEEESQRPLFVGFGEIIFHFPADPITGKPVPLRRNINIPLGGFHQEEKDLPTLQALLLIFTSGEKHPVQYKYQLEQETTFYSTKNIPESSVNHQIVYKIQEQRIKLIECDIELPYFSDLQTNFRLDGKRHYLHLSGVQSPDSPHLQICEEQIYID